MIKVSTSWSKLSYIIEQIRTDEKVEFWSHDHNFDLMKFDLMIISLYINNSVK